jgi:uncharacterized DUF497 family protein
MTLAFDPAKDAKNREKHKLSLAEADGFDFTTAVVIVDDRKEYDETRYIAYGYLAQRLHVLVFTMRGGVRRVISLRKANKKEQANYDEKIQNI